MAQESSQDPGKTQDRSHAHSELLSGGYGETRSGSHPPPLISPSETASSQVSGSRSVRDEARAA